MKKIILLLFSCVCVLSVAQRTLPKIKEIEKAVDKKKESKSTSSEKQANTTSAQPKKDNVETSAPSSSEGQIPKASKAYIPWTNYDRNIKLAKQAQAAGDQKNFSNYVKYCERNLTEMKTKDASLDYSTFDTEISALRKEVDQNASNAASAGKEKDAQREALQEKMRVYRKLYETQSIIEHSSRNSETPISISGKEYMELASGLDKAAFTKSVEEWIAANPGDLAIKDFKPELDDYENYIEYSGILKYSNKLAERSYELSKQKNTPKAMEAAENAKGYCKGVLVFSPSNQNAKAALAFAEKAYNNASASMGMALTGNFHKEHINQIVFSKNPLVAGSENASDVATTFTSNDAIYGTIYFSDKMINIIREGGTKFYLTFEINDEKIHFYEPHVTITEGLKQNSYLQFALVPNDNYDYSIEVKNGNKTIKDFNEKMASKAPVTFKIQLDGELAKTGEKIHGEFNYDISGGTAKNEKVQQKIEGLFADAVRLPKPAMSNPDLLAKMTQGMNENAGRGEKYSNGRITSGDWKINKNGLGIITDRSIAAYFVATYPDGHCEMVGNSFFQEYAGNGTYSSGLRVFLSPFQSEKMRCENAGK